MPQADVSKLVSKLRIKLYPRFRNLKNPKGPEGRHEIIKNIVTGLFKYERIELNYTKADEARGYAERLISEAIRHGDCHQQTMELANYWLVEKQVVHKLFNVLVPRYQNYNIAYTRMHKVSQQFPDGRYPRTLLELRGNPFPAVTPDISKNRNLIHNVLLDEAKKEFRAQKYAEMAETPSQKSKIASGGTEAPEVDIKIPSDVTSKSEAEMKNASEATLNEEEVTTHEKSVDNKPSK